MRQRGFTLVELMIAVAILAIIAAVGVPIYRNYIDTASTGALVNNIATMEVFEEDLMMRTGAYGGGTYDVGGGDTSLTTNIGWQPQMNDGTVYVVDASAGTSYEVTATDLEGNTVCRIMPARTPC